MDDAVAKLMRYHGVPVPTPAVPPFDVDTGRPMRMRRPVRDGREQLIRSRKCRAFLNIRAEFLLEEKKSKTTPLGLSSPMNFSKRSPLTSEAEKIFPTPATLHFATTVTFSPSKIPRGQFKSNTVHDLRNSSSLFIRRT